MTSRSRTYRGKSGQWAFVGHRVSGILVFFFLLLHIVAVDFFPGAVGNERRLLSAVVLLTLALGVPGAFVIMRPFIEGRL